MTLQPADTRRTMNPTDILDSGSLRVLGYVIAAALALWWGVRERQSADAHREDWWPTYWFVSAALLIVMGLARAGGLGDLVGELGREQARSSGWYDTRRTAQAVAVVAVSIGWVVAVVVAILRVPPRRRRYLPHVIGLSGIVAFAAVRIVSLHHVDTLLYRRDVAGVRFVAMIEITLLLVTIGATFLARLTPSSPRKRHVPGGTSHVT